MNWPERTLSTPRRSTRDAHTPVERATPPHPPSDAAMPSPQHHAGSGATSLCPSGVHRCVARRRQRGDPRRELLTFHKPPVPLSSPCSVLPCTENSNLLLEAFCFRIRPCAPELNHRSLSCCQHQLGPCVRLRDSATPPSLTASPKPQLPFRPQRDSSGNKPCLRQRKKVATNFFSEHFNSCAPDGCSGEALQSLWPL
jgi:hypothetical protein